MILPIYAFGQPVLKKKAAAIPEDYANMEQLVGNMWETMYFANGVGLAGPQVGLGLRIFMVDTIQIMDDDKKDQGIKAVFINPQIIDESGEAWGYEEGCLSIPDVRGEVFRQPKIKIKWQDEHFKHHEAEFDGMNARVIQHEYDHIEGILFTDKLKPIKRKMVRRKLENIRRGKTKADYKMKFSAR